MQRRTISQQHVLNARCVKISCSVCVFYSLEVLKYDVIFAKALFETFMLKQSYATIINMMFGDFFLSHIIKNKNAILSYLSVLNTQAHL